ncbi:hypothetical protein BHM03_00044731 [Ensete ventricosum]|nr:hypothetical protein BHM03_00044731 [Ensete ventricosum]
MREWFHEKMRRSSTLQNVEVRLVFHVPSWKLKKLPIPDVLAYGKSHEHGFMKKCDGHKFYTK